MRARSVLLFLRFGFGAAERLDLTPSEGLARAGAGGSERGQRGPSGLEEGVEKLRLLADPEGAVCGSKDIKAIIRGGGDAEGKPQAQLFQLIQEIPWHTVEQISGSFVSAAQEQIDGLTQAALRLKVQLEAKLKSEQWSPIDPAKVDGLLLDAVSRGFADKTYADPMKLAKLTRCGARRPPAASWGGDPRRRGTLKAPGGRLAAENAVAAFSKSAEALYTGGGRPGGESLYIDAARLQEGCCSAFGLLPGCVQANLVDLDEKCDDICRGAEEWVKRRNNEQGFSVASSGGSSEAIRKQLAETVAEAEQKQKEMNDCSASIAEIGTFRKEVDELLKGVHEMKKSYEDCNDGLLDAEEQVDETNFILEESGAKLEQLKDALAQGGAATKKIVPLLEKTTQKVEDMRTLLAQTKNELEITNKTLKQLTAANNVIVELREKVSALMIQMVATYDKTVGQRIQKAGLEGINVTEVLGDFPSDIRAFEEGAFQALDDSIDNMTSYCAAAENAIKLSNLKDHPDIEELCKSLDAFPAKKIGDQLQGAIQEHIDEFKNWFTGTADAYQKFHDWATPPAFEAKGTFEPMGFQGSMRSFSRTDFFKSYLARWEHETGVFYQAYQKMMDNFAARGNRQSQLLVQAMSTEKQFVAQQAKLDGLLAAMKKVAATMKSVRVSKAEEAKLFASYQKKLAELGEHAKLKEAAMGEAKRKFDEAWKVLVGFHQQKTSLALVFEELMSRARAAPGGGGGPGMAR